MTELSTDEHLVMESTEVTSQSSTTTTGTHPSSTATGRGGLMEQLTKVLQQQHETLRKQENISRHFSGDVQRVAGRCWSQVHPHINGAVQEKYQRMMEEFGVQEQLARMDRLKSEHTSSIPAWRLSGIPSEDFSTASQVEAVKLVPEFEKLYTQAQKQTAELHDLLKQRREEMERLETEIKSAIAHLSTQSSGCGSETTPTAGYGSEVPPSTNSQSGEGAGPSSEDDVCMNQEAMETSTGRDAQVNGGLNPSSGDDTTVSQTASAARVNPAVSQNDTATRDDSDGGS